MLLRFLDEPQFLDSWRQFGGLETLHSFGISVSNQLDTATYDVARERLARSITSEVRQFIDETVSHHEIGDYYFCHAGVRPWTLLDAQRDQDLLWIRDDFLSSTADYGKIVVHGHTPVEAPECHPNRIVRRYRRLLDRRAHSALCSKAPRAACSRASRPQRAARRTHPAHITARDISMAEFL